MTDPTRNERAQSGGDLAAAARDSSMEKLEGVKGRLAEGAERVAEAVERTADNLEGDGDETVSGFGRSLAGLMHQLAGGLRERDIEQFAREAGTMARRNPGVFLAGSVALGFGIARFFKARPAPARNDYAHDWRDRATTPPDPLDDDAEESLDLSGVDRTGDDAVAASDAAAESKPQSSATQAGDRRQGKSRAGNKGTPRPSSSNTPSGTSGTNGDGIAGGSDGRPTAGGKGS